MKRLCMQLSVFTMAVFVGAACDSTPMGMGSQPQLAKGGKKNSDWITVLDYQVQRHTAGNTHTLTDNAVLDERALQVFDGGQYGFDCGPGSTTCTPEEFFGCPDPNRPCNELTFTYEGQIDA